MTGMSLNSWDTSNINAMISSWLKVFKGFPSP